MLGYHILVRANRESLAAMVRDFAGGSSDDTSPAGNLEFKLFADEFVEIHHNDCLISRHRSEEEGAAKLEEFIARLVLQRFSDHCILHGGCATIGGRRILVTGNRETGITTLLLKLLVLGADVHSDGTTLLRGGTLLPFPRKFRVRDHSLALVPELIASCRQLRSYPGDGGERFRFFDPARHGRHWTCDPAPADAVIFVEPDFDAPSLLEPLPRITALKNLMFQTMNLSDDPGPQIRELSRLAGTGCYRLRLGDLEGAAESVLALPARTG